MTQREMKDRTTRGLRVLFVSAYPRNGVTIGGVESAVDALTGAMSSRPDIEAIELMHFRNDIVNYQHLQVNSKLGVHYMPGQKLWALPTHSWRDYVRAKRIARAFRPDIIHGEGLSSAGDIATRLSTPSVVTIHGMVHIETRARAHNRIIGYARVFLVDAMVRRVLHRARVVISISDYDQSVLQRYIPHSVVRIPNAVRPQFFFPVDSPQESQSILFAGVIGPLKNVDGIIRAFAKVQRLVPGATLNLAGPVINNRYFAGINNEIQEAGINNISYLGNLNGQDLFAALRRSTIVVLFSKQENLPCIIAEAMAMSKPVVSSNVGGVAEMVDHGHIGFLVNQGDEEGLAACLMKLLNEPHLRRSMGERAHKMALEKWEPQTVAGQTVRAYHLALGREHP
jgi:glycosyltransferase involved in cell wall biosynthesis